MLEKKFCMLNHHYAKIRKADGFPSLKIHQLFLLISAGVLMHGKSTFVIV